MYLSRIKGCGFTVYREPFDVDLEALGPGLVAIVGANGSGKTTLIEAMVGALHRIFPSRPGTLYDHANGAPAWIEASFNDDGHRLDARLTLDQGRRKMDTYLNLDGELIATGSAAYAAEVAKRFGSLPLLLAGPFACQTKRGSLLTATRADRKAAFCELLGVDYLEALAVDAGKRCTEADKILDDHRRLVAAAQADVDRVDLARTDLERATLSQAAAVAARDQARAAEAAAQDVLTRARQAADAVAGLVAAERAAADAVATAERAAADANALPARARSKDARRRSALPDVSGLESTAVATYDAEAGTLQRRQASIERQAATCGDLDVALAARAEVQRRQDQHAADLRARDDASQASAKAAMDLAEARRELDLARAADATEVTDARHARERLATTPCTKAEQWQGWNDPYGTPVEGPTDLAGTCPLLATAQAAIKRRDDPNNAVQALVQKLEAEHRRVAQAASEARAKVEALTLALDPPHQDQIAKAEAAVAGARSLPQLQEQLDQVAADLVAAAQRRDTSLTAARDAVARAAQATADLDAELRQELADADAAITTATAAVSTAQQAHGAAALQLDAARGDAADVPAADAEHRAAVRVHTAAIDMCRERDAAVTTATDTVARLQQRVDDLAAAVAAAHDTEVDVGDWTMLAQALGKDGVQALEIDAAAPEVAGITNDLLATCYGPRFSITFETIRQKRDGTTAEDFEILAYDGADARPVEALSGGEKVVVCEAIGLSFAVLNARKNSVPWATFFRDETAGALDPVNARAYLKMLRRAREVAGAHQIIYIAHQPELWQAADAIIHVADGLVRTDRKAA